MKAKTTAERTKKAGPQARGEARSQINGGRATIAPRALAHGGADHHGRHDADDCTASHKQEGQDRSSGTTQGIADLIAATGWQEHSIRAAFTGLRKAAHAIARERDDGGTRYRIAGAA
jgi:hypothetical protein